MKNYWKAIGAGVVIAGLLYYPAMKLVQLLTTKEKEIADDAGHVAHKLFAPAYRGKHKPHHRHTHNGTPGTDGANN